MALYDLTTTQLVRKFLDENPTRVQFTADDVVGWFAVHYPKTKESTIRAHLLKLATNVATRVYYKAKPGQDDMLFRIAPGLFRRYDPAKDPPPIRVGDVSGPIPRATVAERTVASEENEWPRPDAAEVGSSEFAYEHHLRDFLARDVTKLEPGLRLYESEGIPGVEYPIRNRRMDLLCVGKDGALVVVELKVSKGHDRVLGQILTYMGWVRADIADGKPVRGMIVASAMSDEIKTAIRESKADVKLFEYELSFALRSVDPAAPS